MCSGRLLNISRELMSSQPQFWKSCFYPSFFMSRAHAHWTVAWGPKIWIVSAFSFLCEACSTQMGSLRLSQLWWLLKSHYQLVATFGQRFTVSPTCAKVQIAERFVKQKSLCPFVFSCAFFFHFDVVSRQYEQSLDDREVNFRCRRSFQWTGVNSYLLPSCCTWFDTQTSQHSSVRVFLGKKPFLRCLCPVLLAVNHAAYVICCRSEQFALCRWNIMCQHNVVESSAKFGFPLLVCNFLQRSPVRLSSYEIWCPFERRTQSDRFSRLCDVFLNSF